VTQAFRAILALALSASSLHGQQDSVVVRGTIIDGASGRPVAGAFVAFLVEARGWTVADSLGRFVLSPRVRNARSLLITCPRPREAWGETLDSVRINLQPALDTTIVVRVTSARCDLPEFAERRLEVGGLFSLGFEENRFFPEADSTGRPLIWGGNVAGRHAVVGWSKAGRAQRLEWPDPPGGLASSYCYRVRWIGTLIGPGLKDPTPPGSISMGRIANFSFIVDSTLEVNAVARSDCARP
jgi:hypothetical protein